MVTKRTRELLDQQKDVTYLKMTMLPPVPKQPANPTISGRVENRRNNCFVVTNETHIRSTNPGFNRTDSGGFYCH
tara:strand:- start:52 stop:276 length:225 start_codon:yes stop_codon:yes gene_type:complete